MNIIKREFPQNYKLIGDASQGDTLKIFIYENKLEEIDNFLSSDINKELGGVLVGQVFENANEETFLIIDDYIIAEHTNASVSRLTFTHETWEKINKTLEKEFHGLRIVGWFHSHPGHSVFLSSYDIFIQENFFNLDFMVAYVFDPTIKDRGFFYWKDKEIVKSKGFYQINKSNFNNETIKNDNETFAGDHRKKIVSEEFNSKEHNNKKKDSKLKNILFLVLLIINLSLLIMLFTKINNIENEMLVESDFKEKIMDINYNINQLERKINALTSLKEIPHGFDSSTYNQVGSVKYVVKNGDDLKKIALTFYNDESKVNVIMKFNRLKSESDIKEGQEIELPIFSE